MVIILLYNHILYITANIYIKYQNSYKSKNIYNSVLQKGWDMLSIRKRFIKLQSLTVMLHNENFREWLWWLIFELLTYLFFPIVLVFLLTYRSCSYFHIIILNRIWDGRNVMSICCKNISAKYLKNLRQLRSHFRLYHNNTHYTISWKVPQNTTYIVNAIAPTYDFNFIFIARNYAFVIFVIIFVKWNKHLFAILCTFSSFSTYK